MIGGAIAAAFASLLGWVGTRRSQHTDELARMLTEVREWADDFRESEERSRREEQHCRDELDRLRSEVSSMRSDVASMRSEIVRLEQLVRDLGGDPRHPDMHP